ncbi:MAG: tetratricopeptide repeat protein [Myxococcota bacterium]
MTETNWLPGLVVLGLSAFTGAAVALQARRGAALPAKARTRRDELLEEKDAAYALLRDHAAAPADTPEWRAEKARLEREAARVLRELDAVPVAAAPEAPAPAAPAGARSQLAGALWGGGIVAFAGLLAFALSEDTAPRAEGGSVTGGSAATRAAASTPEIEALRAAVAKDPGDVASRNRLGHLLFEAGDAMGAYKLSEEVVAIAPQDPEARTHQALVLVTMGDLVIGGKVLDRVLATDPTFVEALAWRGEVHMQRGEGAKAAAVWERALAVEPGLAPMLEPLVAKGKAMGDAPVADVAAAGPIGENPHGDAFAAQTASPATSTEDVTGRIEGAADLLAKGGILFVSASGAEGGRPIWAQKITTGTLPLEFRLGPRDQLVAGAPTPAELTLTARVDLDGNATTREEGAPSARVGPIRPGATGLVLELR